ncbi:MAG TPA: hypothetical protein VML36_08065 [Nitrospiria bacterium]|nr:hypothetical protein [Nitrospiria bacterium]
MNTDARRISHARRSVIPALILVIILSGGLGGAFVLYLKAGDDRGDAGGYEIVNGLAYPVDPAGTGRYRHDLELYGGKWNVLADRLMRRLEDFWRGKTLAVAVAGLTVVLAAGWSILTWFPAAERTSDDEHDAGRGPPD